VDQERIHHKGESMKIAQKKKYFLVLLTLCVTRPVAAQSALTDGWVGSWAASQQIPEPQNAIPLDDLRDATVRQIFHLSVGGSK
jgi:hypothetical protein